MGPLHTTQVQEETELKMPVEGDFCSTSLATGLQRWDSSVKHAHTSHGAGGDVSHDQHRLRASGGGIQMTGDDETTQKIEFGISKEGSDERLDERRVTRQDRRQDERNVDVYQ